MREYRYTRPLGYFKIALLMDQILAIYPELITGVGEDQVSLLRVEGADDGSFVRITLFDDDGVNESAIAAIIDAHDSSETSTSERISAVYTNAKTNIESVPGWATWTGAEAAAWIDASVTDLTTAKTALIAMARVIVELRNALYPDLEGS
jgi:hypothetical protein